ncbi:MAG: hypothetical protein SFX73_30325 [Kofleriaceae bacterium]|nr:hypothetical protein [Kofleriaceae bacterium]
MRMSHRFVSFALLGTLANVAACGDDGHDHDNEEEVITTVALNFAPSGGGAAITAEFDDPDGDGGQAGTADPISLAAGTYTLTVRFENRLEDPPEDITAEIEDESDQHLILYTGSAVNGPASNQPSAPLTQSYADMDANGIPIGLENQIVAAAGTGTLTVTLRHMPEVNGTAVKTATVLDTAKASGIGAIGGSTDVMVNFMVSVQ